MGGDAREAALAVLTVCRKAEAWADGALKAEIRRSGLSGRDAALATRITYGVLQNQALLDYDLQQFCNNWDLEPVILDILRIGACQMLFLDRIPHSAAVNSAVEMTKRHRRPRAAGMVNAVLRNLSRNQECLTLPRELSVRYSHPQWLVDRYVEILGREEAETCLSSNNTPVPTTIQRNRLLVSREQLLAALEGMAVTAHPWMEDCYEISATGDLEQLPAFQRGYFQVQDAAAALVAKAAGCAPGQRVIDVCAAPGGKSFSAAMAMENKGEILAFDIHRNKLRQITAGAERLGISCIATAQADGRTFRDELEEWADVVICDVPCSGLGIIRKKPDIRYKDPAKLSELPAIQRAIIGNAARYVRKGGVLLYSTCTILPEENEGVTTAFLAEHPQFTREAFQLPFGGAESGEITLWPHRHQTDGFYLCKLRRAYD